MCLAHIKSKSAKEVKESKLIKPNHTQIYEIKQLKDININQSIGLAISKFIHVLWIYNGTRDHANNNSTFIAFALLVSRVRVQKKSKKQNRLNQIILKFMKSNN